MTEIPPIDWKARLEASQAAYVKRQEARKAERAEFKRRRDAGLRVRHAAKFARNRPSTGPSTTAPEESRP